MASGHPRGVCAAQRLAGKIQIDAEIIRTHLFTAELFYAIRHRAQFRKANTGPGRYVRSEETNHNMNGLLEDLN